MVGFIATHGGSPGPNPNPDGGHLVGDGASGDEVEMRACPLCPTAPLGLFSRLGWRLKIGVVVGLRLLCFVLVRVVICKTAGRGATEVYWMLRPGAL